AEERDEVDNMKNREEMKDEGMTTIYIWNVAPQVEKRELRSLFGAKDGEQMFYNKRSKVYAITFQSTQRAQYALRRNGLDLYGQEIAVRLVDTAAHRSKMLASNKAVVVAAAVAATTQNVPASTEEQQKSTFESANDNTNSNSNSNSNSKSSPTTQHNELLSLLNENGLIEGEDPLKWLEAQKTMFKDYADSKYDQNNIEQREDMDESNTSKAKVTWQRNSQLPMVKGYQTMGAKDVSFEESRWHTYCCAKKPMPSNVRDVHTTESLFFSQPTLAQAQ
ncbi:hypothetical protein RFI_20422, partial [Reticulomyxa filosa]